MDCKILAKKYIENEIAYLNDEYGSYKDMISEIEIKESLSIKDLKSLCVEMKKDDRVKITMLSNDTITVVFKSDTDDIIDHILSKYGQLKEISDLYKKTFDWGCNDDVTILYAHAVYGIINDNEIFKDSIEEIKEIVG